VALSSIRRPAAAIGWLIVAVAIVVTPGAGPVRADTSPPVGSWTWPVRGPVIRGFEAPPSPFSPGHRGIDIATSFGTPVRAPADGTVTFAGEVAGSLFVTIDHGDGYRSTSSWVSQVIAHRGQVVVRGEVVALSGRGHPEIDQEHLHFGVRHDEEYVDPVPLLEPASVVDMIRLAPLDQDPEEGDGRRGSWAGPRVGPWAAPAPRAARAPMHWPLE
jgi:murein DD-endopeptidase MepM/ murein hydrolase activator NlpD